MSFRLWTYNDYGVDWREIQLDQEQEIEMNLALKDFANLGGEENNLSYFTYDFDVTDTQGFRDAYGLPHNKSVTNKYRGRKVNAQAVADFKEFNGELIFLGHSFEDGCVKYKMQFIAGYRNFSKLLQGVNLCDLVFEDFEYSQTAIEASEADINPYDGSTSYWWSLKYYGDTYGEDYFSIECRKPDVYYKAIIDKLSEMLGVEIKSCFFDTEYFRRYMAPYSGDGRLEAEVISAESTNDIDIPNGAASVIDFTDGDWVFTDSIGLVTPFGNTFDINGDIEFTVKASLNISEAVGVTYVVFVDSGLNTIGSFPIQNGFNEIEFTHTFETPDSVGIFIGNGLMTLDQGSKITVSIKTSKLNLIEDLFLTGSCLLECCPVLDWFQGLTDKFNLVKFYDNVNDFLIVEPRFDVELPTGEFCQGFYSESAKCDNWSDKIDCSKSTASYYNESILRNTLFSFLNDRNDTLTDDKDYLSGTIELSDKFSGEQEIEIKCIAATENRLIPERLGVAGKLANVPYLISFDPTIVYDAGDAQQPRRKTYDFKTRMLYKVGTAAGNWNAWSNGNNLTSYPYATMLDDLLGINIGFADSDNGSNKGTLSIFYAKSKELWENGFFVDYTAIVDIKDICDLQAFFRNLKYIKGTPEGQGNFFLESGGVILNKCGKVTVRLNCF